MERKEYSVGMVKLLWQATIGKSKVYHMFATQFNYIDFSPQILSLLLVGRPVVPSRIHRLLPDPAAKITKITGLVIFVFSKN